MRSSVAWAAWALLVAVPALAQVRVDAFTEVRSIRFQGTHAIAQGTLRSILVTRARGPGYRFRAALGRLPFVPGPESRPFRPIELQRDVVRLRRAYAAEGYLSVRVRYDVARDEADDLVDITFVIDEGRPAVITAAAVRGPAGAPDLPVPPGAARSWAAAQRPALRMQGQPLSVARVREGAERLGRWWQDRGYPRATVTPRVRADSARTELELVYEVAPGSPARFGEVRVEGTEILSEAVVRRQVPIERGDPFSARSLEETRTNLREMELVRMADVTVPSLPVDSIGAQAGPAAPGSGGTGEVLLPVEVRVTEAQRRLVSGDIGYVTDAGVSTEARWQHLNFTGGGRSLAVTALAQTGWLSGSDSPDRLYRVAVSLQQPAVAGPRTSVVVAPFIEHRDDVHDRSTQTGFNTTLVHRRRGLQSASLDYQFARRHVEEYRFGDLASGEVDLFTFLAELSQTYFDELGTTLRTSTLTASGVLGGLDDAANPRRGLVLRPEIQVSTPATLSSTSYWRIDGSASGYLPLGRRVVLATRLTLGRLFPFGRSVPGPGADPTLRFLQLRDVTFTGGGTGDVRGWDNRLLGPKVPDIRLRTIGDSVTVVIDGFLPVGGFARTSFSCELQLPLPGFGPRLGSHVFLDGGRVWTSDSRFDLGSRAFGQERLFLATGGGLDVHTPVGPVKVSLGYKINPGILDLVDAADLTRALSEGLAVETLPRRNSRRWQWHIAIGASY